MKRFIPYLILTAIIGLLSGCIALQQTPIQTPTYTGIFSPDPQVWRPDTTRVLFQNYSSRIHIQIWVGRMPNGKPNLELAPEEGRPFHFSNVGLQTICIAGREKTRRGWHEFSPRELSIDIHPTGGLREIAVGDWNFYDTYYYPPQFQ